MNQSIRLCRGEELRPPSVTKSLQCRYASRGVPYGPRKIEVVSEEPHIAVMHDFIMVSNEYFFLIIGWEPGGLKEGPLGSALFWQASIICTLYVISCSIADQKLE